MDGCETPFVNAAAVAGKIAFIDRGVCGFAVKAKNAQLNGAIGCDHRRTTPAARRSSTWRASIPPITIPSLSVSQNDGTAIKAQAGARSTRRCPRGGTGTDNSVALADGRGCPPPLAAPSATCGTRPATATRARSPTRSTPAVRQPADSGGVHSNSGVPNHAYALLVDGGSYNGQTIAAIGLTKAAHIYFRAQSVYQGPASDFADHADALEQSCADLIGANLADLLDRRTVGPGDQRRRTAPKWPRPRSRSSCGRRRPSATSSRCWPRTRRRCARPGAASRNLLHGQLRQRQLDDGPLDRQPHGGHGRLHAARLGGGDRPARQPPGRALFGIDFTGGTCAPGGDESGVLQLVSPQIIDPCVGRRAAGSPSITGWRPRRAWTAAT